MSLAGATPALLPDGWDGGSAGRPSSCLFTLHGLRAQVSQAFSRELPVQHRVVETENQQHAVRWRQLHARALRDTRMDTSTILR